MPWQPWHWAMRFWRVVWLLSAACALPAARSATARILERGMETRPVVGRIGSRELYLSVLLEERLPRARRRQVEALPQQDADLHQLPRDLLGLHVLGDGLQPEAGADAVDRLHQRIVQVALGHALHEETVDLDAVHGEVLEVVERRQPAAEIVQQEAHAHGAQALDQRARALHVGDGGGLGDLEAD